MYTRYFGFSEKPFTLTPNPRFLYLSKNHKEAFAHLLYGINNHYGFIELVGEVGTGKTTVLRTLLDQLQGEGYRSALIFNPCMTSIELLRSINTEFGIAGRNDGGVNELLTDLNSFLLEENSRGATVVLVIDEAQNLQPEVLEQIRLISNLETEDDKLIQIILAGQPELESLLAQPGLRQLNQRIAVRYTLSSMNCEETGTYIRHRMHVAGETGGVSFTSAAIRSIYLYTRGLPRLINILCDRALLVAFGDEKRSIGWLTVLRAVFELISRRQKLQLATGALVLLFAIAGAATLLATSRPATGSRQVDSPRPPQAIVQQRLTSPDRPVRNRSVATELASMDRSATQRAAVNALLVQYDAHPVRVLSDDLSAPKTLQTIASRRKLRVSEFRGRVADMQRHGVPFLLRTKVLGTAGDYHLAVEPLPNGTLRILGLHDGAVAMPLAEVEALSDGTNYVLWQNSARIPVEIKPGQKRAEVRALQKLLQQAGAYSGTIDGIYSDKTVAAILAFQKRVGLPEDEQVGEATLALLYAGTRKHDKGKP